MCLVEYSPALNGPGTKCDASFFPLILDLKCVWTLDLSIFLSFEFRISGQSSVAPSRAAWASKDIRGDVPYISGQKIAHSRIAKRQGRRIGGRGDDDIVSFTPLLLVFPHTRAMPSCISPSLNNSYSLFHIHPHVLNPLHRQRIPQPLSYPPATFIRLQSQPAEVVLCLRSIYTIPLLIFFNDPNATLIKPITFHSSCTAP